MAGTIRPNEMNVSTTPVLSSKPLPDLNLLKSESKKPALPRAPRIDIEPLYTTIKSSISDSEWVTYKSSLTSFLLGNLNQDELSQRLDRILTTPALEHAHNSFMMGIYSNMWRDAPEPGVASWVSSSAKPSSNLTKGTGDESEKRPRFLEALWGAS
jgi:transcriptional coactivator HFI1/ADA1